MRADRPSFVSELQRWAKDIPNSLSISSVKRRISSTSLVYNSIIISAFITGLLVLLAMEFAYYLTRVAQENEARAVKDKLNTEQRLRSALNRVRRANQDRQQAEELARTAAEKSEQAIQEKQEAEEATRAINQQAIQKKMKAEEIARIAAEKSEQAIQEKLRAEKAALIAAAEREQARRNEKDLYDAIEIDIKKATRELEEKVEGLERENNQLKSVNNTCRLPITGNTSEKNLHSERNLVYFELTESDFYDLERKELILDILKNVHNIHSDSRRHHVLKDLVSNNASTGNRETLKAEIQSLFKDYKKMNEQIRNELERMGFEIVSEKNHYKIRFREDNRYTVTFAKTPSDHRAGMNIARDICNLLL